MLPCKSPDSRVQRMKNDGELTLATLFYLARNVKDFCSAEVNVRNGIEMMSCSIYC